MSGKIKNFDDPRESEWENRWNEKYKILEEHFKLFGHFTIRYVYDTWELTQKFDGLKRWVTKQREYAKKGNLKINRYKLLMDLGLDFKPILSHWMKQYQKLAEYKDKFGTCVINRKNKDYEILFNWCFHQRALKGVLSAYQIKKLDELGFNWKFKDERWYDNIEKLKEYKKKNGHCNVPDAHNLPSVSQELKKLARFVSFQRQHYSKGLLDKDYYQALIEIGFDFFPIHTRMTQNWKRNLEQLMEYKKKYGDCNVPDKWKENRKLASWVRQQRKNYKTMPEAKRRILDDLGFSWVELEKVGFIWDAREYNFNKFLNLLREFKEKYGHCNVTRSYNEQLFLWANNIRQVKRGRFETKLSESREKKLTDLGFDWEPKETSWENHYSMLLEYKLEYGSCNVERKRKFRKLYRWIDRLREIKDKLPLDKINRLDEIGFDWDADIAYRLRNNINPAKS